MKDTIAAIATAPADAAVSIIRISGEDAAAAADAIADIDLKNAAGYSIHHGHVMENGKQVDEVLFSVFRAPRSYTGEDIVEISCHGGMFITRKILSLVLGQNVRMAERGEFTERAFLNGKMDLSQAEGVNDLIRARDSLNAESAMHSLKGSVKRILDPLRESLTQIISQIEVNIDYPEYDDVHQLTDEEILPEARSWLAQIRALIEKSEQAVFVKSGVDTVILGRPNVGKSSLLNALLEEDKAIVTDIAGTTRDLVEGSVRIGDITLNLIDTAGIHEGTDAIEKIGIEKSLQALDKADLVIVVLDGSEPLTDEDHEILDLTEGKERIIVYNKKDQREVPGQICISALHHDIEPLVEAVQAKFAQGIAFAHEDTLNNERQIGLAVSAEKHMQDAVQELEKGAEPDLVTIDLQECWNDLGEITGQSGREQMLDEIFSRFCLGK